jgi:hypothetical protein
MNKIRHFQSLETNKLIDEVKSLDKITHNEMLVFGITLYKLEGQLKPSFCIVKFLSKYDKLPQEIIYHYEDFIIIRKIITLDDFYSILEKIRDATEIELLPEIKFLIKVNAWQSAFVFSNQNYGYINHHYPEMYYQTGFTADVDGYIPDYPLVTKDLPPYPNGSMAIEDIFQLEHRGISNLNRMFILSVPDYRAKISSLQISNKKVTVKIESKFVNEKDLRLQFYISGKGFTTKSSSQPIKKRKANIILANEPEVVLIILQNKDGELIDEKEVNLNYVPQDKSIKVEIPSYSIKEMIAMGETSHVELKSKLDNPEPFVSSIISFSNTDGGRIFVGVDNHSKIVGIKDPDAIKEKIVNWIAEFCDPRIDVDMQYSKDLNIIIVDVPKGNQGPYCMKHGGCFIRQNGTDRQATRTELEQLFKRPRNNGNFILPNNGLYA